MRIRFAETDTEIQACFPVMSQLRPHLFESEFVSRVRRQIQNGYHLAFIEVEGRPVAVAGFRVSECLGWGKFLYVDDLVTLDDVRSQGYGRELFEWLVEQARHHHCDQLHLDSGVQRFGAHRFYLRQRMDITSHHFAIKLPK